MIFPNLSTSKAKRDLPNFSFLKITYSKRGRNCEVHQLLCASRAEFWPGHVIADSFIFSPQNEPGQGCS